MRIRSQSRTHSVSTASNVQLIPAPPPNDEALISRLVRLFGKARSWRNWKVGPENVFFDYKKQGWKMADSYQADTKKHGLNRRQFRCPSHCGCGAAARLLLIKGPKVSHCPALIKQGSKGQSWRPCCPAAAVPNLTAILEQTAAIILSLSWLL